MNFDRVEISRVRILLFLSARAGRRDKEAKGRGKYCDRNVVEFPNCDVKMMICVRIDQSDSEMKLSGITEKAATTFNVALRRGVSRCDRHAEVSQRFADILRNASPFLQAQSVAALSVSVSCLCGHSEVSGGLRLTPVDSLPLQQAHRIVVLSRGMTTVRQGLEILGGLEFVIPDSLPAIEAKAVFVLT
jgi:hypothetical protein